MRNLRELDFCRLKLAIYDNEGDHGNGAFCVPTTDTGQHDSDFHPFDVRTDRSPWMLVIASNGGDWDHVSVSVRNVEPPRCPTWQEMSLVHRHFFRENETAMQLHIPECDHINFHPFTLHIWRPRRGKKIPRPPGVMVGPTPERRHAE